MTAAYRISTWAALAALCGAAPGPARAHVGPDLDTNNRYLKLTPMRDRVRLVYVVYFGERPGAQARRRIDGDGDGVLSDAERDGFTHDLAAAVAENLAVEADGRPYPIAWSEVHLGLGRPATAGGSFSVDLVAWLCLADAPRHRLLVRDHYRLPSPGETALHVEASPGIALLRAAQALPDDPAVSAPGEARGEELGARSRRSLEEPTMTWQGESAPLADPGFELAFEVLPANAPLPALPACDEHGDDGIGSRAGVLGGALFALSALLVAAGLALRRSRRRDSLTRS